MISFNMNNYNSNVVESDRCPNMRYDLLYKSNYKIKNIIYYYLYYYLYSNISWRYGCWEIKFNVSIYKARIS